MKKFFRKIEKTFNKAIDKVAPKQLTKIRKSISRAAKKYPIIRYIAIAAAVYFTAGAALGAMGALAAGGSFWGGVGAGLSSSASGLVSGSFLGGAYGAGAGTAAGAASGVASGAATGAALGATEGAAAGTLGATEAAGAAGALEGAGAVGATQGAGVAGAAEGASAASSIAGSSGSSGLGAAGVKAAAPAATNTSGGFLSGLGKFATSKEGAGLIASTGLQLASGQMKDRAEQKDMERQERLMQEEIDRRNANQNLSGLRFNQANPRNDAILQTMQNQSLDAFGQQFAVQQNPEAYKRTGLIGSRMAI